MADRPEIVSNLCKRYVSFDGVPDAGVIGARQSLHDILLADALTFSPANSAKLAGAPVDNIKFGSQNGDLTITHQERPQITEHFTFDAKGTPKTVRADVACDRPEDKRFGPPILSFGFDYAPAALKTSFEGYFPEMYQPGKP